MAHGVEAQSEFKSVFWSSLVSHFRDIAGFLLLLYSNQCWKMPSKFETQAFHRAMLAQSAVMRL